MGLNPFWSSKKNVRFLQGRELSLILHTTLLELHSTTALQHSPHQLK